MQPKLSNIARMMNRAMRLRRIVGAEFLELRRPSSLRTSAPAGQAGRGRVAVLPLSWAGAPAPAFAGLWFSCAGAGAPAYKRFSSWERRHSCRRSVTVKACPFSARPLVQPADASVLAVWERTVFHSLKTDVGGERLTIFLQMFCGTMTKAWMRGGLLGA